VLHLGLKKLLARDKPPIIYVYPSLELVHYAPNIFRCKVQI